MYIVSFYFVILICKQLYAVLYVPSLSFKYPLSFLLTWCLVFVTNVNSVSFSVHFIHTNGNKILARSHDRYTFFKTVKMKNGFKWRCCCHSSKNCSAFLVLNNQGKILRHKCDHTHSPPEFMVTSDGTYVRL